MSLDIQFKLKSNPYYLMYIRENSYWYKFLNRNPDLFKDFEEEVKTRYGLRPSDKINKVIDTFSLIQALLSKE